MRHPSDTDSGTHTDEPTLDDLLWELDVTTARPESQTPPAATHPEPVHPAPVHPAPVHPALAPPVPARPAPAPAPVARASKPPKAPKAPKAPKRGRFHRPELESRWARLSRNRVVQAVAGSALLAGTALLVVVALGR